MTGAPQEGRVRVRESVVCEGPGYALCGWSLWWGRSDGGWCSGTLMGTRAAERGSQAEESAVESGGVGEKRKNFKWGGGGLTSQICEQGTGRARAGELGRAVGQWHGPGVRWWDWAQVQDTILWRCWTPCGDGATLDLGHWGSYLQPRASEALTYHTHTDTHIQGHTHAKFVQQHTSTCVTWGLVPGIGRGWPITLNFPRHNQPCSDPRGNILPILYSILEISGIWTLYPKVLRLCGWCYCW